jgi:hypothetical protein
MSFPHLPAWAIHELGHALILDERVSARSHGASGRNPEKMRAQTVAALD